ncbi:MAG: transcription elongation factor GreA [Clostridia bacterium]|nr:transcription elongation factor GreA [Clostridia bacterium]MBR0159520.1 transcription elongation factor GreA [Clostridia bacterium]
MSEKNKEKPVHLTKEGLEKLQNEFNERTGALRREISDRLEEARKQGDLSENSEYDDAKEAQRVNEEAIVELQKKLDNYVIIDEDSDTSTVKMGHRVTLIDCEYNEEEEYYIVGSSEADPLNNRISNESPVGAAILGHKKGETVDVKTQFGVIKYKIKKIRAAGN